MLLQLPQIKMESRWPRNQRMYMLPWEEGLLLTMLDNIKPKRMIEFGVQEGRTAHAVLKWIDSVERYVGVDVPPDTVLPLSGQQPEVPKEAGHMVKTDPRFELILRQSSSILGDSLIISRGPYDVAFIDGDHSYDGVSRDFYLAKQIVPLGGWIFFHDYSNGTVEVTKFLDELHQGGMKIINIAGTMLAYTQL